MPSETASSGTSS